MPPELPDPRRLVRATRRRVSHIGKRIRADGFLEYEGFWWKLALPQPILAVHLGIVAVGCAWAAQRSDYPLSIVCSGLITGWALWSLFEYVVHRWLLHHVKRPLIRRIFWEAAHKEHHSYTAMRDPDHHGVHLAITTPSAALVLAACAGLSQGGFLLAAASGWILGYCSYEALHWIFHGLPAESAVWRVRPIGRLYAAHTVHHLHRANRNYGFVTQFWDYRFGSAAEAAPEFTPVSDPASPRYS